jgi:hypothetical protein
MIRFFVTLFIEVLETTDMILDSIRRFVSCLNTAASMIFQSESVGRGSERLIV